MFKFLQYLKCKIPFSFHTFMHRPVYVVGKFNSYSRVIECGTCGKQFAMNDRVEVILPFEGAFKSELERFHKI